MTDNLIVLAEITNFYYQHGEIPEGFFLKHKAVSWQQMPRSEMYFNFFGDEIYYEESDITEHFENTDCKQLLICNAKMGRWPSIQSVRQTWEEHLDCYGLPRSDIISQSINDAWDKLEELTQEPTDQFFNRGNYICLVSREMFKEDYEDEQ